MVEQRDNGMVRVFYALFLREPPLIEYVRVLPTDVFNQRNKLLVRTKGEKK